MPRLPSRFAHIALAALGALLAAPTAGAQSGADIVTKGYEIHGSNPAALRGAQAELESAAAAFRRYFGDDAPKIVVVLFESPQAEARADLSRYYERHLLTLPWVASGAGSMPAQVHALAHEACHLFLMGWVEARMPTGAKDIDELTARGVITGGESYGHPRIPDWFDEAAATLCESPYGQSLRRSQLAASLDRRIPFAQLFSMEHPSERIAAATQPTTSDDPLAQYRPRISVTVASPSTDAALLTFYAEALTVAQFLTEREGDRFLAVVADGLMHGQPMHEILRRSRSLPADSRALEAEWVAWMRK